MQQMRENWQFLFRKKDVSFGVVRLPVSGFPWTHVKLIFVLFHRRYVRMTL